MPCLAETYSRSTGLQIKERPFLTQDFYPLPFDRYITLSAGSNQPAKNYDWYNTVVEILAPYLGAAGINVVLLGGKDDPGVNGTYDLRGKTNYHQSYYVLQRSLLHLSNDTWLSHAAGILDRPLVALFGSTDTYVHGPYWRAPKTTLLESHRWGRKPSFSAQESPKTVNLICPFSVARAVLDLLDIPHALNQRTLFAGPAFNASLLEWLPNIPLSTSFNPEVSVAARFDLVPNETVLAQTLQGGRKLNVLTKSPIHLGLLQQTKPLIQSFNYEVDDTTPVDYVMALKKVLPATEFFTRETDADKVAALRFRFFDIVTIKQVTDKTRADFENSIREYVNDPTFSLDTALKSGKMEFKTNKYVLSNGKIYTSLAHEKADIPVGAPGANAVMDEDYWVHDINHFLVYTT